MFFIVLNGERSAILYNKTPGFRRETGGGDMCWDYRIMIPAMMAKSMHRMEKPQTYMKLALM